MLRFDSYTQMSSKVGNWTRRRPRFESGEAGVEGLPKNASFFGCPVADKLKKFGDASGFNRLRLSDVVQNQLLNSFVCKWTKSSFKMRKVLWLALFFGAYIWMVSTGNEQFVIEKAKACYKLISDWFQDADIDFHLERKKFIQKKSNRPRRWD